eukprot:4175820-Pleurochrysis_carterae.AAC.3
MARLAVRIRVQNQAWEVRIFCDSSANCAELKSSEELHPARCVGMARLFRVCRKVAALRMLAVRLCFRYRYRLALATVRGVTGMAGFVEQSSTKLLKALDGSS